MAPLCSRQAAKHAKKTIDETQALYGNGNLPLPWRLGESPDELLSENMVTGRYLCTVPAVTRRLPRTVLTPPMGYHAVRTG